MKKVPVFILFWLFFVLQWVHEALNRPVVSSLLDVDFYKLNMLQVIYLGKTKRKDGRIVKLRNIKAKYKKINRSKNVRIADVIPESVIRYHLNYAMSLRFTKAEVNYLRSLGRYEEEFLQWLLSDFALPAYQLVVVNGQYQIVVEGSWAVAMYWETILMSIVAELYARYERKLEGKSLLSVWVEGDRRLSEKIAKLKKHISIRFVDFGTRRRFARLWQEYVLLRLDREVGPMLVGTSNVYFAWKLGFVPIGTMAHEMFMMFAAIHHGDPEEVKKSQVYFLQLWADFYGEIKGALMALTDTFGFRAFLDAISNYMNILEINLWNFRQDSGSTDEFCETALNFWEESHLYPNKHTITYSDGLNVDEIIRLHTSVYGRYNDAYGWGTDLMNDVGIKALSIVVKALEAWILGVHQFLVKLSDASGKFTCSDLETLLEYLRIFDYPHNEAELRANWEAIAA